MAGAGDEATQIDSIAKDRGWFRPADDSIFYPIIQDYVNGKLDLSNTTEKLFGPIDKAIVANRFKEDINMMDFWVSIVHSARRISFRNSKGHSNLIELVRAFRDHPEPSQSGDQDIYKSMTDFGLASREMMNDTPGVGKKFSVAAIHAYTNWNYFFARVTDEELKDFWLYAIWVIRDALETPQNDDGEGKACEKYSVRVPAAAAWVLVLNKKLYRKEEDLTPKEPGHGNPAKGGPLWKGKAEFSKERWALWKKRFEEIGGMDEVSEEARNIAKEAVEVMNESEKA